MADRLRAGSVPYLNVAPLVRGLEGRLELLPPSQLAVALREGRLDAGLLSVTEALFDPQYEILEGPCVASDGEVYSVILSHRPPLEEVRVVHCHAVSLTSVNLLRVLLAERGLRPEFRSLPDPALAGAQDFALLIGDPAIAFRRSHPSARLLDLGRAWQELTDLPFVYAAWILRRRADTSLLAAELSAAAERGRRELDAVIRERPEFDEAFRREYLTRHTRHTLGPRERAGIRRFAELLRTHVDPRAREPHYRSAASVENA